MQRTRPHLGRGPDRAGAAHQMPGNPLRRPAIGRRRRLIAPVGGLIPAGGGSPIAQTAASSPLEADVPLPQTAGPCWTGDAPMRSRAGAHARAGAPQRAVHQPLFP